MLKDLTKGREELINRNPSINLVRSFSTHHATPIYIAIAIYIAIYISISLLNVSSHRQPHSPRHTPPPHDSTLDFQI